MKAVIWTDVFQSVIILGGLIAVCIVVRRCTFCYRKWTEFFNSFHFVIPNFSTFSCFQGVVKVGGFQEVWDLNDKWDRIEFFKWVLMLWHRIVILQPCNGFSCRWDKETRDVVSTNPFKMSPVILRTFIVFELPPLHWFARIFLTPCRRIHKNFTTGSTLLSVLVLTLTHGNVWRSGVLWSWCLFCGCAWQWRSLRYSVTAPCLPSPRPKCELRQFHTSLCSVETTAGRFVSLTFNFRWQPWVFSSRIIHISALLLQCLDQFQKPDWNFLFQSRLVEHSWFRDRWRAGVSRRCCRFRVLRKDQLWPDASWLHYWSKSGAVTLACFSILAYLLPAGFTPSCGWRKAPRNATNKHSSSWKWIIYFLRLLDRNSRKTRDFRPTVQLITLFRHVDPALFCDGRAGLSWAPRCIRGLSLQWCSQVRSQKPRHSI